MKESSSSSFPTRTPQEQRSSDKSLRELQEESVVLDRVLKSSDQDIAKAILDDLYKRTLVELLFSHLLSNKEFRKECFSIQGDNLKTCILAFLTGKLQEGNGRGSHDHFSVMLTFLKRQMEDERGLKQADLKDFYGKLETAFALDNRNREHPMRDLIGEKWEFFEKVKISWDQIKGLQQQLEEAKEGLNEFQRDQDGKEEVEKDSLNRPENKILVFDTLLAKKRKEAQALVDLISEKTTKLADSQKILDKFNGDKAKLEAELGELEEEEGQRQPGENGDELKRKTRFQINQNLTQVNSHLRKGERVRDAVSEELEQKNRELQAVQVEIDRLQNSLNNERRAEEQAQKELKGLQEQVLKIEAQINEKFDEDNKDLLYVMGQIYNPENSESTSKLTQLLEEIEKIKFMMEAVERPECYRLVMSPQSQESAGKYQRTGVLTSLMGLGGALLALVSSSLKLTPTLGRYFGSSTSGVARSIGFFNYRADQAATFMGISNNRAALTLGLVGIVGALCCFTASYLSFQIARNVKENSPENQDKREYEALKLLCTKANGTVNLLIERLESEQEEKSKKMKGSPKGKEKEEEEEEEEEEEGHRGAGVNGDEEGKRSAFSEHLVKSYQYIGEGLEGLAREFTKDLNSLRHSPKQQKL